MLKLIAAKHTTHFKTSNIIFYPEHHKLYVSQFLDQTFCVQNLCAFRQNWLQLTTQPCSQHTTFSHFGSRNQCNLHSGLGWTLKSQRKQLVVWLNIWLSSPAFRWTPSAHSKARWQYTDTSSPAVIPIPSPWPSRPKAQFFPPEGYCSWSSYEDSWIMSANFHINSLLVKASACASRKQRCLLSLTMTLPANLRGVSWSASAPNPAATFPQRKGLLFCPTHTSLPSNYWVRDRENYLYSYILSSGLMPDQRFLWFCRLADRNYLGR